MGGSYKIKAPVIQVNSSDIGFQIYSNDGIKVEVSLYKIESNNLISMGSKTYPVKKFFEMIPSNLIKKPLYIVKGKPLEKFSHFEFNEKYNDLNFVMSDGSKWSLYLGKGASHIESKGKIDSKIEEYQELGIKIPSSEIKKLSILLPDLYGKIDFQLSNKVLPDVVKFDKNPYYSKFLLNIDNESRTGKGIRISENGISVHGMIGNLSSGYRSKSFEYTKKPTSLKELKTFMGKSGCIDYIISLSKSIYGEIDSYHAYIAAGGSKD
jgi:hypothetical protein